MKTWRSVVAFYGLLFLMARVAKLNEPMWIWAAPAVAYVGVFMSGRVVNRIVR